MDKLKQYVVLAVMACLVVLAAGWFLLVSPKQSDASALRDQTTTQVAANTQLQTQLQILKAQAKDLPKQQAKLAAVAARIPDNPALPAMIRALTAAATSAGVELVTVTPGPPAGATATPAGAPVAPGKPTAAASGLLQIPLTLNVAGGYFQVEQFVSNLENLPRALRVSNLTLAPGANPVKPNPVGVTSADDGKTLTSTIQAQVFMNATPSAAVPITLPGQPAPAGPAAVPAASPIH